VTDNEPASPQVRSILDVLLATEPLGDAEAVIDATARLSYRQLWQRVAATAETLHRSGLGPGDRVAVCLPNEVAAVVSFLAIVCSRMIWMGLDPRSPLAVRQRLIDSVGAAAIVARPAGAEGLRPAGIGAAIDADRVGLSLAGDGASRLRADPPEPGTPAIIGFTSGTTGSPRSVVHSHWNLLLPGYYRGREEILGTHPRMGVCLPLSIGNVMALGPLFSLQTQTICVLIDTRRAPEVAEQIARERVTTISLPPAIVLDLVRDERVTPERIASLDRPSTGGAGCSDELKAAYRRKFGVDVARTYGLTEVPTVAAVEYWGVPTPPGSSGQILPYLRAQVVDGEGRPLPLGEVGEIWLSAATEGAWAGYYTPMLGEWTAAGLSRADGGPLRTGDVGFLDADGTVTVVDRKRSLIVRGGANVSPAEVEKTLQRHPGVRESAVFGLSDERLGERVVALVAADEGVSAAALTAYARGQLAAYQVPSEFYFAESLPRNAMLKIDRPAARRVLGALLAGASEEAS
jgi:long-chain acyl-CoA synthetase